MSDLTFNKIAAGVLASGLAIFLLREVATELFHQEPPEKPGYAIAVVEEAAEGGAAAEVLMCHHDGYTMDKNEYRIYHDPASGQLVFLPHGLDRLFAKADEPLIPDWKGLVAKAVLTTPAQC